MRKNAAPLGRAALIAGLLLVTGIASRDVARAATGQTPWLGVYMQELTPELREGMDYADAGGVILNRIVTGGPADRAGLRKGDLVVKVGSRTVGSPAELQDVVRTARVGESLPVEVLRDGQRRTITVRLAARPSDAGPGYGTEAPEAPETPEAPEAPEAPGAPEPPDAHSHPAPDMSWQDDGRHIIIRDLRDPKGLKNMKEPGDLEGLEDLDLPGGPLALMGTAARGRLGVRIESLSPGLGDYFSLKDGKGALVLEVLSDTPAERAGLKAGDVITRVDDQAVTNAPDLVKALRGKEGRVALRVVRHGTPRTLEAALERAEPARVRLFENRAGERPGVQKRIILRSNDRDDLRHELDQLRRQLDELKQRLDGQQQEGDGE